MFFWDVEEGFWGLLCFFFLGGGGGGGDVKEGFWKFLKRHSSNMSSVSCFVGGLDVFCFLLL